MIRTPVLLYLVWGTDNEEIRITSSVDFGDHWSPSVRVSDAAAVHVSAPSLQLDPDGTLYVLWDDFRSGTDLDIYLAKSTDQGPPGPIPRPR